MTIDVDQYGMEAFRLGDVIAVNDKTMRLVRISHRPPTDADLVDWPDADPDDDIAEYELMPDIRSSPAAPPTTPDGALHPNPTVASQAASG